MGQSAQTDQTCLWWNPRQRLLLADPVIHVGKVGGTDVPGTVKGCSVPVRTEGNLGESYARKLVTV